MKPLRDWLTLRLRYWRRRALAAEAQVVELRADLEAETWRNRMREDTYASAAVLGSKGMYGLAPRTGPARQRVQPTSPPPATDGWDGLSFADKHEFDMFWKADAEAAGIPIQQAKQKFMLELASRRQPLNDDYSAN